LEASRCEAHRAENSRTDRRHRLRFESRIATRREGAVQHLPRRYPDRKKQLKVARGESWSCLSTPPACPGAWLRSIEIAFRARELVKPMILRNDFFISKNAAADQRACIPGTPAGHPRRGSIANSECGWSTILLVARQNEPGSVGISRPIDVKHSSNPSSRAAAAPDRSVPANRRSVNFAMPSLRIPSSTRASRGPSALAGSRGSRPEHVAAACGSYTFCSRRLGSEHRSDRRAQRFRAVDDEYAARPDLRRSRPGGCSDPAASEFSVASPSRIAARCLSALKDPHPLRPVTH